MNHSENEVGQLDLGLKGVHNLALSEKPPIEKEEVSDTHDPDQSSLQLEGGESHEEPQLKL